MFISIHAYEYIASHPIPVFFWLILYMSLSHSKYKAGSKTRKLQKRSVLTSKPSSNTLFLFVCGYLHKLEKWGLAHPGAVAILLAASSFDILAL